MPAAPDQSLAAARRRIAPAYDAGLFREAGHALTDALADHLGGVMAGDGPVLNWNSPDDNIAAATAALRGEPVAANEEVAGRVRGLVGEVLKRGQNLHSPRYVGHQVPASVPIAGLFDAVGSVTNQPMAIYEMGPFASAAEAACVNALGEKLGFEAGTFAGFVTHGGSLANTTCLLTARNVKLPGCWEEGLPRTGPAPVIVAHGESHYCIARSGGVLGLGTKQIVKAKLNDRRQIDPAALNETLNRLTGRGRADRRGGGGGLRHAGRGLRRPARRGRPVREVRRLAARRRRPRRGRGIFRTAPAFTGRRGPGGQRHLGRPQDAVRPGPVRVRVL